MTLTRKKKTWTNPFVKDGINSAFNINTPMWLEDIVLGCIRVMTPNAPYTGNTRNETCKPSAVIRMYKNMNELTRSNVKQMLSISDRQVSRYMKILDLATPLIGYHLNRPKGKRVVRAIGLKDCYWLEKDKVDT